MQTSAMRNGRLATLYLAQECPPPPQPEQPKSDDLFANEINGFGNYGVTSGDAYTILCWRPTCTTCPGVCWTEFQSIVLGPRWRFRQATTRDPCGNFGIRLSVPLNRTKVMVADNAYDVPRSVCWDGVLEHCVATCKVECVRKVRNTTLNQAIGFK